MPTQDVEDRTNLPGLTPLDERVLKLAQQAPGQAGWCIKNAIRHIIKARRLVDAGDVEMAYLRGATGEEEGAKALILQLRASGYAGADKINPRDHGHKFGIAPFLWAYSFMLKPFLDQSAPQFFLRDEQGREVLDIRFHVAGRAFTNDPPLGTVGLIVPGDESATTQELMDLPDKVVKSEISIGRGGSPDAGFDQAVLEANAAVHAKVIDGYLQRADGNGLVGVLREQCKQRTRALYAPEAGIYRFGGDSSLEVELRQHRVVVFARLLCLIYPYGFGTLVQQALNTYRLLVTRAEIADLEWW